MESVSPTIAKAAEMLLTLPLLQQLRLTEVIAIQVANELDALADVERSEAVCESLKKSMQEAEKALNKKRDKAAEKDTDAKKRDKAAERDADAARKAAERDADSAREAHETACSCLDRNRETLVQLEKKVDELVAKHYRQQSIRLHPDRVGEEFRDDFELLKESAEILMQKLLRQKYVKEMYSMLRLKETGQIEPQMLPQSHKAWMLSYREGRMKGGNADVNFSSNRHNDTNWQKQQEARQQQRQKMQQQLSNEGGAGSGNRITYGIYSMHPRRPQIKLPAGAVFERIPGPRAVVTVGFPLHHERMHEPGAACYRWENWDKPDSMGPVHMAYHMARGMHSCRSASSCHAAPSLPRLRRVGHSVRGLPHVWQRRSLGASSPRDVDQLERGAHCWTRLPHGRGCAHTRGCAHAHAHARTPAHRRSSRSRSTGAARTRCGSASRRTSAVRSCTRIAGRPGRSIVVAQCIQVVCIRWLPSPFPDMVASWRRCIAVRHGCIAARLRRRVCIGFHSPWSHSTDHLVVIDLELEQQAVRRLG
jgi:hypothetical protein